MFCFVCFGGFDGVFVGIGGFFGGRLKRRRFEYTESLDVFVKDVFNKF